MSTFWNMYKAEKEKKGIFGFSAYGTKNGKLQDTIMVKSLNKSDTILQ